MIVIPSNVELTFFRHAEELWQRPGRRVALESLDRSGAQNQHPVRRLSTEHFLPREGDDVRFAPIDGLGEDR